MSLNRRSALHGTALGLVGVLLLTLLPSQGRSDYLNQPLRRYTGYTRPGSPPDQVSRDGKIIFVADDPDERKKAIGGTVYFTVLDRAKGAEGDTWGTGFKNFDLNFVRGGMFEGGASPGLDTSARYLYLYQTVNDRGTDGVVTNTAIRLLVEPKSITSWGYFSGIGFGTLTNEEEGGKKPGVGPAAFKPGEGGRRTVIRPVSAEVVPASAALPENRVYR